MDPALASLLGAVIGGGAVSGSNLLIERARAGETIAKRAQTEMEIRQAARLLYDESTMSNCS